MDHVGASLKRKLGPLPVWGWALITGVVLYVVRNRGGSGGSVGGLLGGTSTGDGTGSSTGTLSDGAAGGGLGDNSALTAQVAQLEQQLSADEGLITKLRKKLRNKGKKKHPGKHPHPPHKKGKKHPGGKTAAKAASRIKAHVPPRRGLGSRRDRTHIALRDSQSPVKPRGHLGRALTIGVPSPSSRDAGRTGDVSGSLGGRSHFGGLGATTGDRHRPEAPPAPGRSTRSRPMGGGSSHTIERDGGAPPPSRSSTRTPAPRHQPGPPKGRKR